MEESKTAWQGRDRQAPKPPRLRCQPLRWLRNPSTPRLRPSGLRRGPVPGRALRRSSTPRRGCSRSASRGWGLRRKTLRLSEGSGLSSRARPWRPSKSKRHGRLRRKRSRPSSRTWLHCTPLQIPSTSTSGKLSATSPCSRVRSPARRRRSKPSLRRLLQRRRPLRTLRRRLSSMPGTPCRLSWINGGNRRTNPKGRALAIGSRGDRRRSISRPRMHRFATSFRYPRSQSSSRARHGPVVSTPTPCPSTMGITTPKNSS
jgi:hypothetical protein